MNNTEDIASDWSGVKVPSYQDMKLILELIAVEAKLERAADLERYLVPHAGKAILHALIQRSPDADTSADADVGLHDWSARQIFATAKEDLDAIEAQLAEIARLAAELRERFAAVEEVL